MFKISKLLSVELGPQIKFTHTHKKINEECSHGSEINQNVHLFNVVRGGEGLIYHCNFPNRKSGSQKG